MLDCGPLPVVYQSSFPFVSTVMGLSSAILSPMTVCFNALLVASFIATKQVHINTTNFLIMCLSISDFLNGAVPMPLLAIFLLSNDAAGRCIGFKITQVTSGCLGFVSVFLTVLIAVDRYLNMNPNLERSSRFYKVFQPPYIYYAIAFVTTSMLGLSIANTFMANAKSSNNFGLLVTVNVILLTIGVCVVATLYIKGYIRIRKFTETSSIYRERSGNATRPQYVRNLYRSVLILVVLMTVIYVPLCIASIFVLIPLFIKSSHVNRVAYSMFTLTVLPLYMNCVINAFVILWFNNVAKQWVLSKMRCCFSKGNRESANITSHIRVTSVAQNQPIAVVTQVLNSL